MKKFKNTGSAQLWFEVRSAVLRWQDYTCGTAAQQVQAPQVPTSAQSWALSVFLIFFTSKKWYFAFFIKLIWLGVGFLNRTGAEIGY